MKDNDRWNIRNKALIAQKNEKGIWNTLKKYFNKKKRGNSCS